MTRKVRLYDSIGIPQQSKHAFNKEIAFLAKKYDVSPHCIEIDDWTFVEPVIFIKGQYSGYLDAIFYAEFENGMSEDEFFAQYDNWNEFKSSQEKNN